MLKNKKTLKDKALDFITAGVGCNCLVVLLESGILRKFLQNNRVSTKELEACQNPICVKSAIVTLEKCKIIDKNSEGFKFTEFGRLLSDYIGLITIFFDGYGALVAHQTQIVNKKCRNLKKLIKWPTISKSSILISEKTVDPVILREFSKLKFSGTICDLGCGHGVMLSKICKKTGNPGLGFEGNKKTVIEARKQLKSSVTIEFADITRLHGVWEDVVILMQAFVFHDFIPQKRASNIMNSYLENFPNLKYFFYIDIMSPSASKNELFPGFDYIHGLLGTPTRSYEETIKMFDQSSYQIINEIPIPDLPNTFLWVLSPQKKIKDRYSSGKQND